MSTGRKFGFNSLEEGTRIGTSFKLPFHEYKKGAFTKFIVLGVQEDETEALGVSPSPIGYGDLSDMQALLASPEPMMISTKTHKIHVGDKQESRPCLRGIVDETHDGTCPYCDAFYTHGKLLTAMAKKFRIKLGLPEESAAYQAISKEDPIKKQFSEWFKNESGRRPVVEYSVVEEGSEERKKYPYTKEHIIFLAEFTCESNDVAAGPIIDKTTGMPVFRIVTQKITANAKLDKMKAAFKRAGFGDGSRIFPNVLMSVDYPTNTDDIGLLSKGASYQVIATPNLNFLAKYQGVLPLIHEAYKALQITEDDIKKMTKALKDITVAQAAQEMESRLATYKAQFTPEELAEILKKEKEATPTASAADTASIDDVDAALSGISSTPAQVDEAESAQPAQPQTAPAPAAAEGEVAL